MKKRILSVCLLLTLLASLLPTAALAADVTAEEYTVTVKNFYGLPGNTNHAETTLTEQHTVGQKVSFDSHNTAAPPEGGYVFNRFVSTDSNIPSSKPEMFTISFTMPAHDVVLEVEWLKTSDLTHTLTLKSAGKGATISVGDNVLATSTSVGSTITADIHPGDMVTVYAGENTAEKKKCSSWVSNAPYMISSAYLPSNTQTVTFPMPSGPANLTARWSDAYWVTVKNYNGTESKAPVLYLPKEQIDIDAGTYAGHALSIAGIVVRDTGATTWTKWNATQGIHANLIHFIF